MALKRERSSSPTSSLDIYKSKQINHEKSRFIGAFSPSLSAKALQGLPEFKSADHRIAAWRKRARQKTLIPDSKVLYDVGQDEDRESWAGIRLQNVLNDTGVEGVVVVARWWGGQNIGPIRFTHIENCAKEAIWKWKIANEEARKEETAKKQKTEEATERKGIEDNLRERDYNILALRELLAKKKAQLSGGEPAPPTPQKPPPDYSKMSMEGLQRVDRARDATISFILKEIDKVDEQLKAIEAFDDSTQDSWKDVGEEQKSAENPSTPKNDGES